MRGKALILFALIVVAAALAGAGPAISDSVDVKFDQWMTPSTPAYPHDPAVAPDGSVWYTGQRANVIGRFDPPTQQFKERLATSSQISVRATKSTGGQLN